MVKACETKEDICPAYTIIGCIRIISDYVVHKFYAVVYYTLLDFGPATPLLVVSLHYVF